MPAANTDYTPPSTAAELLRRYAAGERRFPETDLDGADLSGVTLAGAVFDESSFHDADFEVANLRDASFRSCNVKCAIFRGADLRGASFQLAAVEAAEFEGSQLDGTSFEGAGCYGHTIHDGDGFPFRRAAAAEPPTEVGARCSMVIVVCGSLGRSSGHRTVPRWLRDGY